MKLFQQLLVAGAAVSMIAPLGVQATDINLEDMNSYSNSSKSSGFTNNYLNIQPGDWAHQSIKDLVKSRGCDINVNDKALTRFEAASIVNSCLGDVAEVSNIERTLIDEFSSELALLRGRIDGIEARMNEFEAGSFSDTTTMDGKAVFILGAVDNITDAYATGTDTTPGSEAVTLSYVYQMNLNTSFTGDDNLYVRLKAGGGDGENFEQKFATYHNETTDNTSDIHVDKIWYTFPVSDKITATIGPKIENYYMLAAAPSVYKPKLLKAFRFGGHGTAFGASTSVGAGLKYVGDNGFASSITLNSQGGDDTNGILTETDRSKINIMGAYTADNYHVSATYTSQNLGYTGGANYFSTAAANQGVDTTGLALRAWWRPSDLDSAVPTVSVGFDSTSYDTDNGFKDGNGYSVALNWTDMFQADDTVGVAFGQPIKGTDHTDGSTDDTDPFIWELYYSFRPNDSIEITPGIFGGTDVNSVANTDDDVFGAVVATTFKF